MASVEIPSRAKPEALHQLCKHLRGAGAVENTTLYEEMEIDRRQIRASIDYGSKLGFLETDGDIVTLADRGQVISYNESMEESAVQDVFREAIESYEPYREALLRVHNRDSVEEISGDPCILQSTFKESIQQSTGDTHSNREINLLIKTLEAAGFGEFITGRRGKETRLKVDGDIDEFLEHLANKYDIPEQEEKTEQTSSDNAGSRDLDESSKGRQLEGGDAPGELKLTVELDVSDKNEKEIARIIEQIRNDEI